VGIPPHDIVSAGITHVPEGRLVFPNLTVEDNLLLGSYIRKDTAAVAEDMERVFSLFSRLKERRNQEAGTLSGGEQQMLAVGRALMGRGTLMILDEPSMGLAPILVEEVFRTIVEVRKSGMTILLVEQNANQALAIADRGYVLETGRIVLSGKASDLAAMDEDVRPIWALKRTSRCDTSTLHVAPFRSVRSRRRLFRRDCVMRQNFAGYRKDPRNTRTKISFPFPLLQESNPEERGVHASILHKKPVLLSLKFPEERNICPSQQKMTLLKKC
jgi:ABC-type branched-subunit amino acid transport system ATPase component